jgi:hypothetical protein
VAEFRELPHRDDIHADWVIIDLDKRTDVFDYADACADLILAITDATSNPLANPGKLLSIVERVKSAGVSQHLARALDERMLRRRLPTRRPLGFSLFTAL